MFVASEMWEIDRAKKVTFYVLLLKSVVWVNIGVNGAVGWHSCHFEAHSVKCVKSTFNVSMKKWYMNSKNLGNKRKLMRTF